MVGSTLMSSTPAASAPLEEQDAELDEQQRLVAWEFLCLLDLGFTIEQATLLIREPFFSWHAADTLLKKGWPHATVVDDLT